MYPGKYCKMSDVWLYQRMIHYKLIGSLVLIEVRHAGFLENLLSSLGKRILYRHGWLETYDKVHLMN